MRREKTPLHEYHLFLDEAGDATFFESGGNRLPIAGQEGVSGIFMLGMVRFHTELHEIRQRVADKQVEIAKSIYFRKVYSVAKREQKGGFYFHAKDDPPDLRKEFLDLILTFDCSFKAVVGNKDLEVFSKKHNGKKSEFYADLLSHLISSGLPDKRKVVLNIAELDSSTGVHNLNFALEKARNRRARDGQAVGEVQFNIRKFKDEPLLAVADYFCWAVQRVYQQGETRFYEYLEPKIERIVELYNKKGGTAATLCFDRQNPLTEANKIASPQSP